MQGAILRVKLRHLEQWTDARRAHAMQYDQLLANSGVETPKQMPWARHVYHVYTVLTDNRDELKAELEAEGIQTAIHYPVPAHLQPAFADLGYRTGAFPHSEVASRRVLSLPLYPELSAQAIWEVASAVRKAVSAKTQSV